MFISIRYVGIFSSYHDRHEVKDQESLSPTESIDSIPMVVEAPVRQVLTID
jgi:hypothetical protein